MRRASAWILSLMLLLVFAIPAHAAADSGVRVLINGAIATFDNTINDHGRVLVPLKDFAGLLGLKIDQSESDQAITLTDKDTTIVLKVDATTARVNGKEVSLDTPARTVNGQTYIPLRFVAEAADTVVSWNQRDGLVELLPARIFLDQLLSKDQQGDQKLTGNLTLKYALGGGALGLTIDMEMKMQLESQIYKGDSLTKLVMDMDGDTTTIEEAVVGGKAYMRDYDTAEWIQASPEDLESISPEATPFGDLDLAKLGQDLLDGTKASLAGTAELDGAKVFKIKLEVPPAELERMAQAVGDALAPVPASDTPAPDLKVDHYTFTFWVNPDTMYLHRIEVDMDSTISGTGELDGPSTIHMVVKGSMEVTPQTQPIQFPADLPK